MDTSFSADWFRLRHHVVAALKHAGGTHTDHDVLDMINGKEAQFWPAQNSVMVTEVIRYPALLSCRIWLAGGEYVELREIEKQVIEWARSIGCTRMELSGRRGWARKLAEDWKEVGVIMAKGIKNE